MSIRQFNASYVATEDRILLRVTLEGEEEFRFWLTRAGLKALFRQVDAWLAPASATAEAALQAFRREAGAARADFQTPHQPGQSFPLGETPVLVEAVTMAGDGDDVQVLMQLAGGHQARFDLTGDVLLGMQQLLQQAGQAADWGLAPATELTRPATVRVH